MEKPYLGEELTEVVRRWARPTTPAELQARGIRSVRSVSMNRVAGLIEKAVNRTLLSRTLGDNEEDHGAFSQAAREEFVRMVRGSEPLTEAELQSPKAEAESVLDRLKQDLARRRQELKAEQSALAGDDGVQGSEDGELEARLRRLFVAWGADAETSSPLEEEIIRLSVGELRSERKRSRQGLIDQHRREMDILERRLTKLTNELERTEGELARMAAQGFTDEGVASIYTEVQGLGQNDSDSERKGALMSAIFEANLELQAKLASPLSFEAESSPKPAAGEAAPHSKAGAEPGQGPVRRRLTASLAPMEGGSPKACDASEAGEPAGAATSVLEAQGGQAQGLSRFAPMRHRR